MTSTQAPEGVDPGTGEIVTPGDRYKAAASAAKSGTVVLLNRAEAEALTAKIKGFSGVLCQLLREAHDKQAWRALGYDSFVAYVRAEFGMGKSRAYQLVLYAAVIDQLAEATEVGFSTLVETLSERDLRGLQAEAVIEGADLAPDDTPTERVEKVRESVTHSRTTTYEASPEQKPSTAPGDSGGEASEPPAATSPQAPTAQRDEGEGIGAEQDPAADSTPPADLTDVDGSGGVTEIAPAPEITPDGHAPPPGADPDATPELVASGSTEDERLRAEASKAVYAVRRSGLLGLDAKAAAAVLAVADRPDRTDFCYELIRWATDHLAGLDVTTGPRGIA